MRYTIYMPPKGKRVLNMNIDEELLAAIDEYRFDKRLDTRSLAIEELLRAALERNTKKPGTRKKGE
jgi:metal-responsive CopG/Arc/MetJ family transcriptional regulator